MIVKFSGIIIDPNFLDTVSIHSSDTWVSLQHLIDLKFCTNFYNIKPINRVQIQNFAKLDIRTHSPKIVILGMLKNGLFVS